MNLGNAFKRIRFEKKMKQVDVAKKAKISQTYLSLLEKGQKPNPSQSVIKKLCKIYDVPQVVLIWYATEDGDIKPDRKKIYNDLKPVMDSLINQIVIKKLNP